MLPKLLINITENQYLKMELYRSPKKCQNLTKDILYIFAQYFHR